MTKLHYLELNDNQLSGHIPPELGKLTDLFDLNVANNNLEGPIPDNLSSCTNLNSLNLRKNRLSGYILAEFGNLRSVMKMPDSSGAWSASKFVLPVLSFLNDIFDTLLKELSDPSDERDIPKCRYHIAYDLMKGEASM
ncbi:hypothetical protein HHK36_021090 [Tetracentron sinense]|uniref:Uncharacterized protein n=1 Tax=Tetracentron sinense TaxID=13715 RepID=A0A835D7H7_TETSI|nr:hypothetical protein HHK36_021090 [Tetracentron sinense]